jgi:hypothetical protein
MATYYKSRVFADPVVYVQENGWWVAYAAEGMRQEEGSIPEEILAEAEEITPEEAERLIYLGDRTQYATAGSDRTPRRRALWALVAIGGIVAAIAIAIAVTELAGDGRDGRSTQTSQQGVSNTSDSSTPSVVAKVGGERVTKEELDRRVADFETQYTGQTPDPNTSPEKYRQFQQGVLDYMITYELARQKAEALGITLTDEEVQREIDSIRDTSFGGDQAEFDRSLAEQGLTQAQFKQSYGESLLLQEVYAEVTKDITTIADTEIQAYYDQHKGESYADKSLDEVRQQIGSILLDEKKKGAWLAWIERTKQEIGVTYADGWKPTD